MNGDREGLTADEREQLRQLAESDDPWADAVAAYLAAFEEVDG